ncbi:MAG: C-GCAxxG-C-C family protein [Candidatus Thermoplasmatota archaeon]|nr:C-GCAxxG-C-C family protein [Candidatus Thermoplasmatota archaeon]
MRAPEEGVGHADKCWAENLNCAESVLRGVCFAQSIELSDQSRKMATPFGGGVGRSEDVCGALIGGVLAIGLSLGRTTPEEDRLASYEAAGKLYKAFQARFGSTCCKVLNRSDFKTPEHRARCGEYVDGATRLAIHIIREG